MGLVLLSQPASQSFIMNSYGGSRTTHFISNNNSWSLQLGNPTKVGNEMHELGFVKR